MKTSFSDYLKYSSIEPHQRELYTKWFSRLSKTDRGFVERLMVISYDNGVMAGGMDSSEFKRVMEIKD